MKKAIIFDLDGTLLNTIADLASSMNEILVELGLEPHDVSAYKHFVGNGMKLLVRRALPENYPDYDIALERFLKRYEENLIKDSSPYEGIMELLHACNQRDIPIAISTNKANRYTQKIVNHYFGDIDFVAVYGDRFDGKQKPNPIYPLEIAEKMQVSPRNIYYVGDSNVDIQTAQNAKMNSVGVSWGFRGEEELRQAGADLIIHHPLELLNIL